MGWEVIVLHAPPEVRDLSGFPADFRPVPLGAHASVLEAIREVVPDVEFSKPELGFITGEGFGMEVFLGEDDPVDTVMVKVVGGEGALEVVARIMERLGAQAFDIQTAERFEPSAARASFGEWSAFRDRMVRPPS